MNDYKLRIARASKTILGDVVFNLLMVFALLFIILPHNPKKEEAKTQEVKSAGDMMVEIHWPDKVDIDIDLWVKSPDDELAVGYSNRAGKTFNLLRDDLGMARDSTTRNYEMAYSRGLPPGEYVINLHYYADREPGANTHEVPVDVIISIKTTDGDGINGGMRQAIIRKAILRATNEELTVVRFVILENGELDKESINDFHKELRTWIP